MKTSTPQTVSGKSGMRRQRNKRMEGPPLAAATANEPPNIFFNKIIFLGRPTLCKFTLGEYWGGNWVNKKELEKSEKLSGGRGKNARPF